MKKVEKEVLVELRSCKEGYLTIELTVVFSALFFSLMLILFIGLVLYQEVRLQSLAIQTSERGSVIYSSRVSDMSTGVKTLGDFTIRDPYRNIPFLDSGNQRSYESLLNQYISNEIGRYNVLSGDVQGSGSYVAIQDYIVAKKVRVNLKDSYKMPVDVIAETFHLADPFTVDTTAVSTVVDSPEFVRTADLAIDIAKRTSIFGSAENGYNQIFQYLQEVQKFLQ